MHLTLPSRLALTTLGCALLSAALWGWSRGLPEPNWESSSAPVALAPPPEPASGPAVAVVATPTPRPKRKPKPAPVKEIPSPTPALAQATPQVPVPAEPIPSVAPTAEPSPLLAEVTPTPAPTATPVPFSTPSDAELAGPLPEHSSGEPVAAVVVKPANLEIGDIARQPQLWPPQVLLVSSQRFPVVIKGVNVGNVQVPAGRAVTLRKVNADGTLEIEFQGSPAKVKAQATDLAARATALAASREKAGGSF